MTRRIAVLLLSVLVCLAPSTAAQTPDLAALERTIEQARRDWNVPGLSVRFVAVNRCSIESS